MRRMLQLLGVLLALTFFGDPAHAAVPVGISDQSVATLQDPLFRWTGVTTVRIVAPWDAALHRSDDLNAFLFVALVDGLDPLVSFEHRSGEDCRVTPCSLPTPAELGHAFGAFRSRWPWVTEFSAWNEGNHASQPTANAPSAAARLYETLAAACPECRIVAAEVVDAPNMVGWLDRFKGALTSAPQLWGLHDYSDVTRGGTAMTDALLGAVPGEVWITETGGIVRQATADGQLRWPYDEERARASVARAFALADAHADRIGRLYLYQWRAGAQALWDSGLLRPDGAPRPSFAELAARVRPGTPVPPPPPPPPPSRPRTRRGPARHPRLHVVHARRLDRDGVVRVRLACAAASCLARMVVRTLPGHGAILPLGAMQRAIRAGARRTLAVRLPPAQRRLIRLGHSTTVAADVGLVGKRHRHYVVRWRR